MSRLSSDDYKVQWLALTPPDPPDRWWHEYCSQPELTASGLPWHCSLPEVISRETGFRNGALKGLSGVQGKLHAPFLGGYVAAMRCGYPTTVSSIELR